MGIAVSFGARGWFLEGDVAMGQVRKGGLTGAESIEVFWRRGCGWE